MIVLQLFWEPAKGSRLRALQHNFHHSQQGDYSEFHSYKGKPSLSSQPLDKQINLFEQKMFIVVLGLFGYFGEKFIIQQLSLQVVL